MRATARVPQRARRSVRDALCAWTHDATSWAGVPVPACLVAPRRASSLTLQRTWTSCESSAAARMGRGDPSGSSSRQISHRHRHRHWIHAFPKRLSSAETSETRPRCPWDPSASPNFGQAAAACGRMQPSLPLVRAARLRASASRTHAHAHTLSLAHARTHAVQHSTGHTDVRLHTLDRSRSMRSDGGRSSCSRTIAQTHERMRAHSLPITCCST